MKRSSLIVFLFIYGTILFAQRNTIILNKDNSSQTRRQMKSTYVSNLRLHFEPNISKFSKMDSLVYFNSDTIGFIHSKRNGRVLFSGLKPPSNYLAGKVLFFYKNGKIKRIESWGNYSYDYYLLPFTYYAERKGKWRFYKTNGDLSKEILYYLEGNKVYEKTIKYDRNGDIKSGKTVLIMEDNSTFIIIDNNNNSLFNKEYRQL